MQRNTSHPDSPHSTSTRLYWRIRSLDRQTQMATDLLVLVTAYWFAYLLRFEFSLPNAYLSSFWVQLPIVLLVQILAAYAMGIYSFIWRFVGLAELKAFLSASILSLVPLLFLRFGLGSELQAWKPPLSVILMDSALAFGGMLGLRILRRVLHERSVARRRGRHRSPDLRVLILGADHTGIAIAREVSTRGDTGLKTVGFLDDDLGKQGSVIAGARVLGGLDELVKTVKNHHVDQVILAIASASSKQVRHIVELCDQVPVPLRVVPALSRILDGSVAMSRLRPVEIEDLLGREPVQLDTVRLQRFLSGKRVMVTGAGGSIGSEIARQVMVFDPASLILVERAEFALFEILREFADREGRTLDRIVPVVADAGDETRMRSIMSTHRPEVILHAAAHKHVPLMERNACEAVKNNVETTATLSRLAGQFEAETFVLISTDKAVRPSSVMGATKRVAETVVLQRNREYATRFAVVRFGNVLGSTGSVIPIFRDQISKGGPVTITHRDMVRYFMTIPEASQLVLQAGSFGRGGEILTLDMGEPVSILRLAEDMISLSGLKPYDDVEIAFTGLRPGEKIVEELTLEPGGLVATEHPKIFASVPTQPEDVEPAIATLRDLASLGLENDIRLCLSELVPEATLDSHQHSGGTPVPSPTWSRRTN